MVKLRLKYLKRESFISNYFDIIAKLEKYDFTTIQIKGGQSVKKTRSNLTILYDIILKTLRECDILDNNKPQCRGEFVDIVTLKEKGLINEAIFKANKLIQKSKEFENFEVVYETLNELWSLHILQGDISKEIYDTINCQIEEYFQKLVDLAELRNLYRRLSLIYYDHYFKKRNYEDLVDLDQVLIDTYRVKKSSDRAIFLIYEIHSMILALKNDLAQNHIIRKSQLKICLTSRVYQQQSLTQLIVFGHIFVYLKSNLFFNEFKTYFKLFKELFYTEIARTQNVILLEKFYNIYFLAISHIAMFLDNEEEFYNSLNKYNKLVKTNEIINKLLAFRIHKNIIEAFLFKSQYKEAIREFQKLFSLKEVSKYSNEYINAELLFIFLQIKLENTELVDSLITSVKNKIIRNEIEISLEQKSFLTGLCDYHFDKFQSADKYKSDCKQNYIYKILIDKLHDDKIHYLSPMDPLYNEAEDIYLKKIKSTINKTS